MEDSIIYTGILLVTNFVSNQLGGFKERKSHDQYIVEELKKLNSLAKNSLVEETKLRKEAEAQISRLVQRVSQLEKQIDALRDEVKDHNTLREKYIEAAKEINKMTVLAEDLQDKLIKSMLEIERLEDENKAILELWESAHSTKRGEKNAGESAPRGNDRDVGANAGLPLVQPEKEDRGGP